MLCRSGLPAPEVEELISLARRRIADCVPLGLVCFALDADPSLLVGASCYWPVAAPAPHQRFLMMMCRSQFTTPHPLGLILTCAPPGMTGSPHILLR